MGKEQKGGLLVQIMLDESGSMDERRQGVIDGFNQLIQELSLVNMPPSIICSKFSVRLVTLREAEPVYKVPPLTFDEYRPSGGTDLCGTMRTALKRMEAAPYMAKALIVISDGEDGQDPTPTKKAVEAKRKAGWMVAFVGTDLDALKVGESLGVDPDLCLQFGGKKTKLAMQAVVGAITRFNSTRKEKAAGFSADERKKVR